MWSEDNEKEKKKLDDMIMNGLISPKALQDLKDTQKWIEKKKKWEMEEDYKRNCGRRPYPPYRDDGANVDYEIIEEKEDDPLCADETATTHKMMLTNLKTKDIIEFKGAGGFKGDRDDFKIMVKHDEWKKVEYFLKRNVPYELKHYGHSQMCQYYKHGVLSNDILAVEFIKLENLEVFGLL